SASTASTATGTSPTTIGTSTDNASLVERLEAMEDYQVLGGGGGGDDDDEDGDQGNDGDVADGYAKSATAEAEDMKVGQQELVDGEMGARTMERIESLARNTHRNKKQKRKCKIHKERFSEAVEKAEEENR
ncbi:hypothetical protein BGW39_011942, partial [Mortierella sp. 14UC]